MTAKAKTGASQLYLDNAELRRELHRADTIIMTAVSLLSVQHQTTLEDQLIDCYVTSDADPLAELTRLDAMHRITPKRDYNKILLIILILGLCAAWYSVQADNQQLRAELTQVQGA